MQTVLLADDERVFRAIEGTCLRREVCRLVKADAATLPQLAKSLAPDLIVVAIDAGDTRRMLERLARETAVESIPIVALDFGAPARASAGAARPLRRKGAIDRLKVGRDRGGRPDLARLDARLDAAIKRHLPLLKRVVDRVAVSLAVRCRAHGGAFTVRTKNISPSGLFLKTARDLAPGDRILVRFALPGAEPEPPSSGRQARAAAISATCRVVRRVGRGGDEDCDLIPGVGVTFVDIPEDGRTVLRKFIRAGRPPAGTARRAGRHAPAAH